jgi:hypothetical protein
MMKKKSKTSGKWNTRRSELTGYRDSFYRVDRSGDYVRVDVVQDEGRIRLLVEDRRERIWCAVIEKGRIVSETADGSPDSAAVSALFRRKAPSFRILPPQLVRLIQGHYGITLPDISRKPKKSGFRNKALLLVLLGAAAAAILLLFRHLTGLF